LEEYRAASQCEECESPIRSHHRYCPNCGAYLATEAITVSIFNNAHLRNIFIFYFLYLFVCLAVKHSPSLNTYNELFWIEIVLAVVTLGFVKLNWPGIKPILKFNNFNWITLSTVVFLGALASFSVSFVVKELNGTYFHSEVNYYETYRLYTFPTFVMIYSIAVMPAVFEELAFRGIMYNYCSNFLDDRLVVAITAFLFAIMHLSMVSLVWLIPFGFFIGNLRRKYNTLWYGIVFHFVFNLVACLFDLYRQGELF
jgi:membrane protease YdiL (CAAX protease family)